jgi:hypothetical protein
MGSRWEKVSILVVEGLIFPAIWVSMSHIANKVTSPTEVQAEAPRWGGIQLGRTLVGLLYALLVGSAALTFLGRRSPGALPGILERVTPWVFLGFVGLFAFYRLGLVRARKYPAFKAFFQIGLTVCVWLLLMPGSRQPFNSQDSLGSALQDGNPRVRALAAELAGYRPGGVQYAPQLVRQLEDGDAEVRRQAHGALVKLNGSDLGSPEDQPEALEAWRRRFP